MHSDSDNDPKGPLLFSPGFFWLVGVLLSLASDSILQCRASDAMLLTDDFTSTGPTNNNNDANHIRTGNSSTYLHDKRQQTDLPYNIYPKPSAKLIVSNNLGRKRVQLVPGLLEDTLLDKGSFSFGAKLVQFNKLKVLGNVYANAVNGKPLRETYLLKNIPNIPDQSEQPTYGQSNGMQNGTHARSNNHHHGPRYSAQSQARALGRYGHGQRHSHDRMRQHRQSDEIRLQILNGK